MVTYCSIKKSAMKKNTIYFIKVILFIFLIQSCTDPFRGKKDLTLSTAASKQVISTYVIDWENGDYLPSNPSNVVSYPWKGIIGSNSPYLLYDYKSSDGWVLVYNTFSPSVSPYLNTMPPGGLYFALYNRFRGLLRFYLYAPPGWIASSSNIQHGLNLSSSTTSSMLNFGGTDLIDASIQQVSISKTNNQQMQAYGNWILMQYEIAYDPSISTSSYPGLGLNWWSKSYNITDAQLSGSVVGTIKGSINQPASGFNLTSTLTTVGKAAIGIFGLNELTELINAAPTGSLQKDYLNGVKTGLDNLTTGNINGFFDAITGGNSGNSQSVELDVNAKIDLAGTLTNSTGLTNPILVIPGQSNTQTNPDQWIPFNESMGIFNISAKPKIKDKVTVITHGRTPNADIITDTYTIDNTSYTINYNQQALNFASITNVRQQILIVDPSSTSYGILGTQELVGNSLVFSMPSPYIWGNHQRTSLSSLFTSQTKMAIRIAIDVVPNNGAPISTIVKTFLADRVLINSF